MCANHECSVPTLNEYGKKAILLLKERKPFIVTILEVNMEQWENDWINENITNLHTWTEIKHNMLLYLMEKNVFQKDDLDELVRVRQFVKDGVSVEKSTFFSKLQGKVNGYEILIDALQFSYQNGAANLLITGKEKHLGHISRTSLEHQERPPRGNVPKMQKFKKGVPEELSTFLASDDKVWLMSTLDLQVSLEKIRANFVDKLDLSIARNELELRDLTASSKPAKIFVLHYDEAKVPDAAWLAELVSYTPEGSKLIVLTVHDVPILEGEFKISSDQQRWTDLETWFQNLVFRKELRLQVGGELRMTPREFLEPTILAGLELKDEKLILDVINDMTPSLFRPLPSSASNDVERKILPRFVLKNSVIFRPEKNNIFLFTGISKHCLSNYLSSYNYSGDYSANYIIMEKFDHDNFDKICKLRMESESCSSKMQVISMHWLHLEFGNFIWIKSRGNGDMSRIHKAVEGMERENQLFCEGHFFSELENFNRRYVNSPILLADSTGMGKSELLQSMARRIFATFSGRKIVLFVAINDLVNLLKVNTSSESEISEEMFESALLHLTIDCGPEVGKHALKSMLHPWPKYETRIKVELMLDGYDDVIVEDMPRRKQLFDFVRNTYHSARIWVATSSHFLKELEQDHKVLGFTVLPFGQDTAVENTFWGPQGPMFTGRQGPCGPPTHWGSGNVEHCGPPNQWGPGIMHNFGQPDHRGSGNMGHCRPQHHFGDQPNF